MTAVLGSPYYPNVRERFIPITGIGISMCSAAERRSELRVLGNMPDLLSDHVYYNGPTRFTAEEVAGQPSLFDHRAALFLTPTAHIPVEHVGNGSLDVRLPIPTPDYLEAIEIRSYSIPRMWVDLIQRATGKVRWTAIRPARVVITRYDPVRLRDDHLVMGMKAIIDALKFQTTGRGDGQLLYYFGAIWDDDNDSIKGKYLQELVPDRSASGTRIQVYPL